MKKVLKNVSKRYEQNEIKIKPPLSLKLEKKVTPPHFLCLSTFLVKMDGQRDVEGAQWPYFTKNCQMSKTYCPNNMSLFSMNKMHFQDLQSFPATYHFLKFHSNYTKCTLPKNKINIIHTEDDFWLAGLVWRYGVHHKYLFHSY